MEYLSILLNTVSYFCLAGFYASVRRDERGGAFGYFVDFLFYSMAPLMAYAFLEMR